MEKKVKSESKVLKQFKELKHKHPDRFMLFRVGDFYEMYCEDAEYASQLLGITLTKRAGGRDYNMAGFPYHALDTYLPKLIRSGKRVAICDAIPTREIDKPTPEDTKEDNSMF